MDETVDMVTEADLLGAPDEEAFKSKRHRRLKLSAPATQPALRVATVLLKVALSLMAVFFREAEFNKGLGRANDD